ncbi:MAG: hypothetical protein ACJ76I_06845 [Gaiellaceae bacterium]
MPPSVSLFPQAISAMADAARQVSREASTTMQTNSQIVDLADRHSHDLDVVLLWARRSNRLWVNVTDTTSGRTERIDVTASSALDVFNHPLAYATGPELCS